MHQGVNSFWMLSWINGLSSSSPCSPAILYVSLRPCLWTCCPVPFQCCLFRSPRCSDTDASCIPGPIPCDAVVGLPGNAGSRSGIESSVWERRCEQSVFDNSVGSKTKRSNMHLQFKPMIYSNAPSNARIPEPRIRIFGAVNKKWLNLHVRRHHLQGIFVYLFIVFVYNRLNCFTASV